MISWLKTNKDLRLRITQLEEQLHVATKTIGDLEHKLLKAQGRGQKKYREYPTIVLQDSKVDHPRAEGGDRRNNWGFPYGSLVNKE